MDKEKEKENEPEIVMPDQHEKPTLPNPKAANQGGR